MPFAPQIRKQILQALEQCILPALKNGPILHVQVALPLEFADVEHWDINQKYLPHKAPDPLQVAWYWKKQQMAASRFPYLIFMYEGVADHKIGITARLAKQVKAETGEILPGAMMVRLPSPCVAYFPPDPGVPGHSGLDTSPHPEGFKSLCLSIMNQGVRFHLSISEPGKDLISHSLQINDPLLTQMTLLYAEELKVSTAKNTDVAQAQLFVMMSRLFRQLQDHRAALGNSAWPNSRKSTFTRTINNQDEKLCQQTMDYIETRLNSPLSRISIAKAMKLSQDHLGRIFLQATGSTLMRYVTTRRLEAAKLILSEGDENIAEIASLVGFANAAGFCAAFKRSTGSSPKAYRRQHQAGPTRQ